MSDAARDGGCLCGAVRYRLTAAPRHAMLCHCRSCRLASGAPVVAWVTVSASGFAWTGGAATTYPSSPSVQRTFCGTCGTPLSYEHADRPGEIDVTTASLDAPDAAAPSFHGWTSHALPWMHFGDDLPKRATNE
jgi:hypothetical protein